jgi:PiT family inorganic phosphate transporter
MEAVVFAGHQGADRAEVEAYLQRFEAAEVSEKKRMLSEMKKRAKARELAVGAVLAKNEQKALKKAYKKEIVKRSAVLRIVAAWIVTVPATAVLAAVLYKAVAALLSA